MRVLIVTDDAATGYLARLAIRCAYLRLLNEAATAAFARAIELARPRP